MRSAERAVGEGLMCLLRPVSFIYAMSAYFGCGHRGSITAKNSKGTNLTVIHEKTASHEVVYEEILIFEG